MGVPGKCVIGLPYAGRKFREEHTEKGAFFFIKVGTVYTSYYKDLYVEENDDRMLVCAFYLLCYKNSFYFSLQQ